MRYGIAILAMVGVAMVTLTAIDFYRGRTLLTEDGLQRQIEAALPANASEADVVNVLRGLGANPRVTTSDKYSSVWNNNGIEPGTPGVIATFRRNGTWFVYPPTDLEIFVVLERGTAKRVVVEDIGDADVP
jgi:hypothetical protein